jgi:replicative DNA helicase
MVFEVAERRVSESLAVISDTLQSTLDQLESMYGSDTEVVGVPSGYHELDTLLLGLQRSNLVIVAARPAMGKCVAWDTPIVDPETGAVRTAQELYRRGRAGGRVRVLALDNRLRMQFARPSDFVDDGVKPVFRVTTSTGRVIRTTFTHPFLTPTGWKPLREIRRGTRIAVPRRIPTFGHDELPEAEVAMLAFLVGDGCITRGSRTMRARAPAVFAEMKRRAAELGVAVTDKSARDDPSGLEREPPSPVAEIIRRHGLVHKSSCDKRIPGAVYRLPRAQLALFLNRLFATDGWASVSRAGQARILYETVSEHLARGVQHLLLRFGVTSQVRCGMLGYNGHSRPTWQVDITHGGSFKRFAGQIGILGKERALEVAVAAVERRRLQASMGPIPAPSSGGDHGRTGGERTREPASVGVGTRSRHVRFASMRLPWRSTSSTLPDLRGGREIETHVSSDVQWDEIVSITYDGDEQVYDLSVPHVHNFVAGDVFVHNTSFALGAAANVAVSVQRPVMFFSMEMGNLELTKRLLAAEARVEAKRLWTGNIPETDWTRLSHAVGRLAEAPLFIDDNPHCTVMEMRAKARRIRARHGDLGLIVVDYIQLMSSSSARAAENRQVEVAEISRGLKILARELDCPVMALSQLNRQLEYRQDKRPMLADLRESGGLEQDADVVCFIYRDEVYNPESDQRGQSEIIVAKHRNGPTGLARLAFNERFTKFDNMARD